MKKLVFLIALLLALPARSELQRYRAKIGSGKLSIHGVSNVHKWKVETKLVGGYLEIDPAALAKVGKTAAKGKVIVPVRQLKSGKKRMDEVMHAAMNAKTHKLIDYTLSGLEVKSVKDGVAKCVSSGILKINGHSKPTTLEVTIAGKGNQLVVTGSTMVNMKKDFGITPPSPKLPAGKITTEPLVKITFTWVVAR
jgi:polyisoprenoid-binding protein YceI